MIRIGFTGTRLGMSVLQTAQVSRILDAIKFTRGKIEGEDLEEIRGHHGCCDGADLEFGSLCRERGFLVEGHPGPDGLSDLVDLCEYDVLHPVKTNFARNRDIVDTAMAMVATPPTEDRQPRGGTWYTIGYAEKVKRALLIVTPSGLILPSDVSWPWAVPVGMP